MYCGNNLKFFILVGFHNVCHRPLDLFSALSNVLYPLGQDQTSRHQSEAQDLTSLSSLLFYLFSYWISEPDLYQRFLLVACERWCPRPSPLALRRVAGSSCGDQSFSAEPWGSARRGWWLWRRSTIRYIGASGWSRYPEISMQAVRDVEERRKQNHAVIVMHMQ